MSIVHTSTAVVEATPDTGLTAAQVAERVAAGETNNVPDATSRSLWHIFRANVLTLFNGIVISAFLLLLLLGQWQDALFGMAAIANAVIGVVQEYRAKRALDKLALMHAPLARVLRDGTEQEIVVKDVVLGDLLVLRAGDQVPADAQVTSSVNLEIDESLLTGESDPVEKPIDAATLSGSVVVAGNGTAVVVRVGADSFASKLMSEAKRFSLVASELRSSINRLLKWITWAIFPIMLIVINAQMQARGGWAEAISSGQWRLAAVSSIAAIIAMIPLGLVLMTSIAFAVGAVKLARQQVLVQELPAVEGLARVDVICLDKTGTLTEGDIRFDAVHELDGETRDGWKKVLGWFGAEPDANSTARCLASPYPETVGREARSRVSFSSARKWSAVSFDGDEEGTWILGAPEMVLDGDSPVHDRVLSAAATLSDEGRRTLVLAHTLEVMDEAAVKAQALPTGLDAVVLLTFRENVRSDAKDTLEFFGQQGVGVRVISGDNPRTVAAVAREVGLDVAEGYDARNLPTDIDELAKVMSEHHVFGRVTPEQKKSMVVALKHAGHVVAMTGDGVNDALAIKEADIGIAMESGSAATKAVSRLVLLDGQFSHLPGVVAEGRQVIANIERVSMLFLTKTAYAVSMAIVFGILLWTFPFLPRQLSITDGLTIGIPAFFLALLPNPRRYVPGFLKRSLWFAIPNGLLVASTILAVNIWGHVNNVPLDQLRTASTIGLAIVALWTLTVLARPVSPLRIAIVLAMYAGLIILFLVPLSREFFELVTPPTDLLVFTFAIAALACVGVEAVRSIQLRRFRAVEQQAMAGIPITLAKAKKLV